MRPSLRSSLQPKAQRSTFPLLKRNRGRSPLVLLLLLLLWCLILGVGLSQAVEPNSSFAQSPTPEVGQPPAASIGTVDPVPARFQLGQDLYRQNCSTCHIAIPPAVLPTDTWRQLLRDPRHFGAQLEPMLDPGRTLVWIYLRTYSRPLRPEEQPVFRVGESRYFKALHPRLDLPRQIELDSCATCHPGARQYDFRSLTSEWEDAP